MKVQNIQTINYQTNFKNKPLKEQNTDLVFKKSLQTAGIWLGFGLGFDYFCRKCVVFKNSPVKNSLFINSSLALLAGGYELIKGLHKSKNKANSGNVLE